MKTVLVIDDEAVVLRAIVRGLSTAGFHALPADNLTEAERLCADGRVDAIVTDVAVGETSALSFYEGLVLAGNPLAERLVFVTGGHAHTVSRTGRPVLGKPFAMQQLVEVLSELLDIQR